MITNTNVEYKGNLSPGKIAGVTQDVNKFCFYANNGVTLEVTVLRNSLFRFRFATVPLLPDDFSYAVNKDISIGYKGLDLIEKEDHYSLVTPKVICNISKENMRTTIYDAKDGSVICEDELGFHWEESFEYGGNIVKMSKVSPKEESFYGFGDKPVGLNLKGKRFQNWATDTYAYGKDTDPTYRSIPFYISLHKNKSYGIFFDNTFRTHFDFAQERRDVTSFWADGGHMDYYFIYGPQISEVVAKYTNLTGTPELPPLWALGYHQCKWSYYPESKVREVTSKFRELNIPCDAIYLDIDYMDGFRCFTWNKEYFPDPKKMIRELNEDGFKTVVIIDPGIKIDPDYSVFMEALQNDYFCKRADGPYMKGKVWPGECFFPDFTNPKVRDWWSGLYKELIGETGLAGVWNDMNEPAVMEVPNKTFPDDVRHDYDGHPCSHRKAHNIYGMQMARATYHGIKKYAFPKRPFVITRSAYSGTQRYSSTWTGDNIATWEHLWIANVQLQRLAMSGFSFAGTDIGGFAEQPNGELYARWIQLGIFHPLCRTHSSGDHGEQEPWSFDPEITDIVRKFIEMRYRMLPYLYTAFWKYIKKNEPIIKSLVVFDQEDPQTHYRSDEFIFGDHILVCPILEPNSQGRRMYIPRGTWYNYWTHEVVEGGREMWVDANLDTMPLFVQEGAIIPNFPLQQYVGEKEIHDIYLHTFYKKGKETSHLFEDDQDGYAYTKGEYVYRTFDLEGEEDKVTIRQFILGQTEKEIKYLKFKFYGVPFEIKKLIIDNVEHNIDEFKTESGNYKLPCKFNEAVFSA